MWNIEGLKSTLRDIDETEPFYNADVVCLTETYVAESFPIVGYSMSFSPATDGNGNRLEKGVTILTKPWLEAKTLHLTEYQICISTTLLNIICCYYTPGMEMDDIINDVFLGLSKVDIEKVTVICGDFNCRVDTGNRGKTLTEEFKTFGFQLANNVFLKTYVATTGESTIDLIYHNMESITDVPKIMPTVTMRHQRVKFQIPIQHLFPRFEEKDTLKLKRDVDLIRLENHPELLHSQTAILNNELQQAVSLLTKSLYESIPFIKPKQHHHKPWFDEQCKCKPLKDRLLNLKKKNDALQWTVKKEYKLLLRNKREEYEEVQLIKRIDDTEVKPWMLFRKPQQVPSLVKSEDMIQHFKSLYNSENSTPVLNITRENDEGPETWYNQPFREKEVANIVSGLPIGKAPGPDKICYEHLKKSISLPIVLTIITGILNLCLSMKQIPDVWRQSTLKLLFKGKGNLHLPSSYRGIAMLQTMFKLLTSLINSRLKRYIFHLLPPEQFGFQPGKSTKEPVESLIKRAKEELKKPKGSLYACFVDFRTAFDVVDRNLLIQKLHQNFSIGGKLLSLISSILKWNEITINDGGRVYEDSIIQHRGYSKEIHAHLLSLYSL